MTDWNSTDVETLCALWDAGHSCQKIAEMMKTTKNAIVGKAHRLGLTGRPSPIKKLAEGEVRITKPNVVRPGEVTLPQLASATSVIPPPAATPIMVAPMRVDPVPDIPAMSADVVQFPRVIRPCCWPIGEMKTPSFRFCEAPSIVGRPYCQEHCDVAYVRRPRMQMVAAE